MSGYDDLDDEKEVVNDNMKMISIRLPPELIEELKGYCESTPFGYQTLIRNVLKNYVIQLKRQEIRELTEENDKLRKALAECKE